ncbi:MAG: twin-arginine translocase subunit TatC [Anaerolineales bacterium]
MKRFFIATWRVLTAPFRFVFWLIRSIANAFRLAARNLHTFLTYEPEDSPLPDAAAKIIASPRDVLPHFNALRRHLFRAAVVIFLTTAFSFTFAGRILNWLAAPLEGGLSILQAIEVTEPIGVFMRVSLLSGFVLALPYTILEMILFIALGLSRRTRILMVFIVIPAATILFVAGMAFSYYIMLPVALPFLLNFMGFNTAPRPSSYINFVTSVMFWIGVAFEFPLAIAAVARLGWVQARTLAQQWRLAIVIIAIIAAMITPTVDPVNMGIVMGPMILLYFLSIGLAYIMQGRREPESP